MAPGRVSNTISLADQLGVLDRLDVVPPPADRPRPAADGAHPRLHRRRPPGRAGPGVRAGHQRQPGLSRACTRSPAAVAMASRRGRAPGLAGRGRPGEQHQRRAAPRHARADQRVLRLQRHRRGHPLAARPRLRAGRVRRRRRAPRRRRPGDLLRRPARDDGQPARDPGVPVPRHRVPARDRRPRSGGHGRSTSRCRPAPATPAGCGPSTPWCREVLRGSPATGPGHPARLRLASPRPARRPGPERGRAARLLPRPGRPGRRVVRGPLGVHRRRRVRGDSTWSRAPGPICWSIVSGQPLAAGDPGARGLAGRDGGGGADRR